MNVEATLHSDKAVTFDTRGKFRSENVLSPLVRFHHFEWVDVDKDPVLSYSETFENVCDPGDELGRE